MTGLDRVLRRHAARRILQLIRAMSLVLAVEIGLRTVRLPRLCALLGIRLDLRPTDSDVHGTDAHAVAGPEEALPATLMLTAREARALEDARRVLERGPVADTCLRRALVAGSILHRHSPELRIGVNKIGGVVTAHAWVCVDGVSLDSSGSEDFAALTGPVSAAS